MLLGTLGGSLLGNLLTGKGTIRAVEETITAGEGILRVGYGSSNKKRALVPPHPLTNVEF